MAWTDQCKIQAVETIKKVAEDKGIALEKAMEEVSKESEIPKHTLQRWYWPRKKTVKNDSKKSTQPWQSVANRLKSLTSFIEKNCADEELSEGLAGEIAGYISVIRAVEEDFIQGV